MEFDSQLLQDLLDFLRTLEGVSLPAKFENLRGKLLGRVRTAISTASNYMDMKPGKPLKSDNFVADNTSEDYVVADQQPQSPSSFLYQFKNKKADDVDAKQPRPPPSQLPPKPLILESLDPHPPQLSGQRLIQLPVIAPEEEPEILETVEDPDPVLEIYNDMSLIRAEAKSHYFGKLQRREKCLFLFESIRPLWAALVNHHLLIYDNRADQKPAQILSIKGCTCKALVTSQRNVKKLADSTFELNFKDDRSYQFIASTPKEMEQWVAMIERWEAKAHDTNKPQTSPPIPKIVEEEPASENSDSNDYYDDLVIHNIAEALATPAKTQKSNASRSPVGQRTELKPSPEINPKHPSPTVTKVFHRVLPPTPSPTPASEQEDEVYHCIVDNFQPNNSEALPSLQDAGGITDEFYDDIENVRKEVREIEANLSKLDMERSPHAQEIADDDQYDDVGEVRREVEKRRNESLAKESSEVEKEKKSTPPPSVLARSSPMKNFFGRFRHKSESPEKEGKEGAKKKPLVSSPQNLAKTPALMELPIHLNPAETVDSCANNAMHLDLSNYNSLPRPRPVQTNQSFSNDVVDDEGECIYDDVLNKKDGYNNHMVNLKSVLEKRKGNEDVGSEASHVGTPSSAKNQKSVARNLNETFEAEIYQNQSGVGNLEDELEHYQVPRADANAHNLNSLEDDDEEKIYDDVAIVVQKKLEIEKSKQKPVVKTPPKARGPAVMAKPSANKLFNKFNKFPLSVSDKSPSEKNNQHRLIAGKKPKTQEANIPLKKSQLMVADEELYDDCSAK